MTAVAFTCFGVINKNEIDDKVTLQSAVLKRDDDNLMIIPMIKIEGDRDVVKKKMLDLIDKCYDQLENPEVEVDGVAKGKI